MQLSNLTNKISLILNSLTSNIVQESWKDNNSDSKCKPIKNRNDSSLK